MVQMKFVTGSAKKRLYLTIKITTDFASIRCDKKGWEVKDSVRLLLHKLVDNQEYISFTSNCRYIK